MPLALLNGCKVISPADPTAAPAFPASNRGMSMFKQLLALSLFSAMLPLIARAGPAPLPRQITPTAPETVPLLALRAGKFIDVSAGRTLSDVVILVRGKTIDSVGPGLVVPDG